MRRIEYERRLLCGWDVPEEIIIDPEEFFGDEEVEKEEDVGNPGCPACGPTIGSECGVVDDSHTQRDGEESRREFGRKANSVISQFAIHGVDCDWDDAKTIVRSLGEPGEHSLRCAVENWIACGMTDPMILPAWRRAPAEPVFALLWEVALLALEHPDDGEWFRHDVAAVDVDPFQYLMGRAKYGDVYHILEDDPVTTPDELGHDQRMFLNRWLKEIQDRPGREQNDE